jgi:hypothetical protein
MANVAGTSEPPFDLEDLRQIDSTLGSLIDAKAAGGYETVRPIAIFGLQILLSIVRFFVNQSLIQELYIIVEFIISV